MRSYAGAVHREHVLVARAGLVPTSCVVEDIEAGLSAGIVVPGRIVDRLPIPRDDPLLYSSCGFRMPVRLELESDAIAGHGCGPGIVAEVLGWQRSNRFLLRFRHSAERCQRGRMTGNGELILVVAQHVIGHAEPVTIETILGEAEL